MTPFSFADLSRWPDPEAENLVAVDATDRLLLDEAATAVAADPGGLVVIGDNYGALTLGAIARHAAIGVRVHQDPVRGERALAANAERFGLTGTFRSLPLDAELCRDASVVLVQAPKSLLALTEIVQTVAQFARPDVTVYVGGRVKHLTFTMNDVLTASFTDVHATRARQKSRLLVARGPRSQPVGTEFPVKQWHADVGLWVCAHGEAFAGTKIDIGTRFLLGFLDRMKPDAHDAVDLGCGTGILAAALAKARPQLAILATDQSASAVASATATMAANDTQAVRVERADGLESCSDASADLIVCNPPFHVGTAVHNRAATTLFRSAALVLRPGGELWTVYNSHLDLPTELERRVGKTAVMGRNPKFTVARTRNGSASA